MFILYKIVIFIWLEDSVSLADFDAARCHVVNYPVEITTWQGIKYGLWLTSCRKLRTSVQQHTAI